MGAAAAMKANACYSLGGMRGVARAEVLTQLGLTRQAAETYDAMKADHLMRTALAEPGFAVWVRSLLAKARLWKQLGERDKAMAAYQEFILRWKNADGAAAKLVGEAKQELGQLTDAPKKQ
jgi:tetratricopeptide (TPR) repeat protein